MSKRYLSNDANFWKETLHDITGRTIPEGVQNESFNNIFRTFLGFLSIYFLSAHLAWGNNTLIPEPALETQLDWDIAPNGLLYVS